MTSQGTVLFSLMAAVVTLSLPVRGSGDAAKEPTFDDVLRGWERLREIDESGRSYKVTWTIKAEHWRGSKLVVKKVNVGRSYFLLHSLPAADGQRPESLTGINPDYSYILVKKDSPKWSLGAFNDSKDPDRCPVRRTLKETTRYQQYPLSTPHGMSPEMFGNLPGLRILEMSRQASNRLRMRFSRQQQGMKGGLGNKMCNGELILDMAHHYCVIYSSESMGQDPPFRTKREIAEQDGQLVCQSVMLTMPDDSQWTWQFDDIKVNDPPQAHTCYLSHYGLPEPVDVKAPPPPSRSWWPYFLFGAIMCVGVAGYAWRRSRNPVEPGQQPEGA